MKEAVAIAKEADTKKDFLPTKSDKSVHRVQYVPEMQLGSLRGVIDNIRRDGGTPSVDSIATELTSVHVAQRTSALLALQRTHGNRYVQRVVAGIHANSGSHQERASTVLGLPRATRGKITQNPSRQGVKTILRPGQAPQTFLDVPPPISDLAIAAHSIVAPSGAPTVNNSAASSDCLPANEVLNWNVVSVDANNWGVSVTSLTVSGQINISPWPSHPTRMVVPNTPNPADGGNTNNTSGSPNHWQAAIDDMANYNSPGVGGAGPNWHSTAASSAHEWAHWNTDYIADSVISAAGGNWPQTNTDLDALREPKASSPTAANARTALQPRVNAGFATFCSRVTTRWNAIPDTPGNSTGYAAGMRVLNGHIAAVRAYANSKGWTGMSTGAKAALGAGGGALVGAGIGALVGGPVGAVVGAGIGALVGGIAGLFF
jgi:hypothetical protein